MNNQAAAIAFAVWAVTVQRACTTADPAVLCAEPDEADGGISSALTCRGRTSCGPWAPFQYAASADPSPLLAIDVDGDGKLDVVSGTVGLFRNSGRALFEPPHALPVAGAIGAGDFDGDGRVDLVGMSSGGGVPSGLLVALQSNAGPYAFVAIDTASAAPPTAIAVADFNRDGRPDIALARGGDGTVGVVLNLGGGAFAPEVSYTVPGTAIQDVVAGDFDGDGAPDLAAATANPELAVLRNAGDGTFGAIMTFRADADTMALATSDLDGDGRLDVVTTDANGPQNEISVFLNDGRGGFAGAVSYPTGIEPVAIAVGDLNRDGRPDVAVSDVFSGEAGILYNRGVGNLGPMVTSVSLEPGPSSVLIADFDGDGVADLATSNPGLDAAQSAGDPVPASLVIQLSRCGVCACGDAVDLACGDTSCRWTCDTPFSSGGDAGYVGVRCAATHTPRSSSTARTTGSQ